MPSYFLSYDTTQAFPLIKNANVYRTKASSIITFISAAERESLADLAAKDNSDLVGLTDGPIGIQEPFSELIKRRAPAKD